MNHVSFYNEKTPLRFSDETGYSCITIEPSQRTKIRNIGIIVIGLFALALSTYYIYDGVKSLTEKSVKPIDQILKTAELIFGGLGFMFACGLGGYSAGAFKKYHTLKESYPHGDDYQGSIASDLIEFVNSPHSDQFDNMIWGSYLSNFINQFEPVLMDRYFLVKNVLVEDRIKHLRKMLHEGCCKGYAMALIAKMKKNSHSSASELKNSIKIENVVYFQLVSNILQVLNGSKLRLYPLLHHLYKTDDSSISFKQFLDDAEFIDSEDKYVLENEDDNVLQGLINTININRVVKKYSLECNEASNLVKPTRLIFNYCDLFSAGMLFHESEFIKNFESLENTKSVLAELMENAENDIFKQKKESSAELTVSGYINLYMCDSKDKRSGHAFFFQMSDGYFRFMDSGTPLNHFFEFKTKESMIEGLELHMKKCYKKFKDISLRIILVGIPKRDQLF